MFPARTTDGLVLEHRESFDEASPGVGGDNDLIDIPPGRRAVRVGKELGEQLGSEEMQAMIDEFDRDQDGQINEEEFMYIMKQTSIFDD